MKLPYAEKINYWKTSKSAPDVWLARAQDIIETLGGIISIRAMGTTLGRKAFMMEFTFAEDRFRALWPVLPTEYEYSDKDKAAERQAATLLYHDVKARSLRCAIFGARNAFFDFLLLEDGRTPAQLSSPELIGCMPKFLEAPTS